MKVNYYQKFRITRKYRSTRGTPETQTLGPGGRDGLTE